MWVLHPYKERGTCQASIDNPGLQEYAWQPEKMDGNNKM